MLLQPDGRIAVVAETSGRIAMLGYHPDGRPDTGFGAAGTAFGPTGLRAGRAVLQPDGRIVVAGRYVDLRGVWTVALARAPDGKLVAAGFAPEGFLLARYGVPAVTGRQPALPARSKLAARTSEHQIFGQRTNLKWQWRSSDTVAAADFGDPTAGTGVSVCVIDQTADSPLLTLEDPPRAGGPYWTRTRTGSSHKPGTLDFSRTTQGAFGLVGVSFASAGPGQATIRAKQNTFLPVPLPFTGPVRVRLATSDTTACFEAVLASAIVNDATRYQAVSE